MTPPADSPAPVQRDAFFPPPSLADVRRAAAAAGSTEAAACATLLSRRAALLSAMRSDPLAFGFEPGIWQVAWALLDWPWCSAIFRAEAARRLSVPEESAWEEFKARMRAALGFPAPVRDLLVMGANRSGKTDFAAKTVMRMASARRGGLAYFLAQQLSLSAETVQPRLWRYFPPSARAKHMGEDWYVHYKDLKGFTGAQFQLPNGCKVIGKFYSQDPSDALVGGEADFAWADELVPLNWVEELGRRLASRKGKLLLTFTPIDGYTPVVRRFLDGAVVVRRCPGFLLPRDGGPPLPAAALGLPPAEYAALGSPDPAARLSARESSPEDVFPWLSSPQEETPADSPAPVVRVAGRAFEAVPRVARCRGGDAACVWFETMDNPYSGPRELIARELRAGPDRIRTILYGIAVKTRSAAFAAYDERVHVVPDSAVPRLGFNYVILDPAGRRNDVIAWIRSTPDADYVYREWPGSYDIPGVGVPEPWAVESGARGGLNDGAYGGGAASFGFGFLRMKTEIARLEGWRDWREWAASDPAAAALCQAPEEEVRSWDESSGADEPVEERFMDSRPAAARRMEDSGEVTLLDQWNRLGGWDWRTAPGDSVSEGIGMVADALAGDAGRPRLYVAESCRNIRFALSHYTGADGAKGACKDFVDLLRYFYRLGLARCAALDTARVAALGSGGPPPPPPPSARSGGRYSGGAPRAAFARPRFRFR